MNKKMDIRLAVAVLGTLFLVLLGGNEAFASEEIYFDEEGNLIYITYDKKATTSVSYKAIGWILKRYDAPIDEPGQQYAIIRKIEYAVEDPENPAYLYCYFWSDSDELLDAVGKVSSEWRKQLEVYGDTVYIDNVMTVCNSKVPLGNVDENGNCTGEVYFTLEGIQGARLWARPEFLESYFDISLKFPVLVKKPESGYKIIEQRPVEWNSTLLTSMQIGSKEVDNEEFDVSLAIPAGEELYFLGECDNYFFEAKLEEYAVIVYVPVCVNTRYIRNWIDISGVKQTETITVSRWYNVARVARYVVAEGCKAYVLSNVNVTSGLLNDVTGVYEGKNLTVPQIRMSNHGEPMKHVKMDEYVVETSQVVLNSGNFMKPSIPEADYTDVAQDAVPYLKVRSDHLSVNGQAILWDAYRENTGYGPVSISGGRQELYCENVDTNGTCLNGLVDDFAMECVYINPADNSSYIHQYDNINSVNIHTPIVIGMNIYGDKTANQALEPEFSDLIPGKRMNVAANYVGTHLDYKGYGTGNYEKYKKACYVKFEFPVVYASRTYPSGRWILLEGRVQNFTIPEDVTPGQYTVEYKCLAKNGKASSLLGENLNADISEYGAYGSMKVNVIDRIYDLRISESDDVGNIEANIFVAGNMDRDGSVIDDFAYRTLPSQFTVEEEKKVKISVTTLGEIEASSRLLGNITYYYLDSVKEQPVMVDLYEISAESGNESGGMRKLQDNLEFDNELVVSDVNNGNIWSTDYELPYNCVAVEAGSDINEADYMDIDKGSLFIVVDFLLEKDGTKTISYINENNYKRGYCNMWRTQGGITQLDISGKSISLKDGTVFMVETRHNFGADYEVIGTH